MARILLIEDDIALRQMIRVMLRRFDYEVIDAGSSVEALYSLNREGGFDAVLTDIAMPELDGVRLTTILRKKYPELPIIVISAYAHFARRAVDEGAHVSLPKPFTINELVTTLDRAIHP